MTTSDREREAWRIITSDKPRDRKIADLARLFKVPEWHAERLVNAYLPTS